MLSNPSLPEVKDGLIFMRVRNQYNIHVGMHILHQLHSRWENKQNSGLASGAMFIYRSRSLPLVWSSPQEQHNIYIVRP